MRRSKAAVLIVLVSALHLLAGKIDVKRDAPLQTIWYSPSRPPRVGNAFTNGVIWYCYPEVSQSFKQDKKDVTLTLQMIGIRGPFFLASTTFSIDGEVTETPAVMWNSGHGLGGWVAETHLAGKSDLAARIARAREVFVTVISPDSRYSIKLNDKQLAVFAEMADKYSEISPMAH